MKHLFAFLFIILVCGCHKKDTSCDGQTMPVADFGIYEVIGDTAFLADTVYNNHPVMFKALTDYQSVQWQVGDDERVFTQPAFSLHFVDQLITIPVTFTGNNEPHKNCFPADKWHVFGSKTANHAGRVRQSHTYHKPPCRQLPRLFY